MNHELSLHVREEIERRKITLSIVEAVLKSPEQKVPEHRDVLRYQSRIEFDGRTYLVRVMVNENVRPMKVVTVYRTSKIRKYWKETS